MTKKSTVKKKTLAARRAAVTLNTDIPASLPIADKADEIAAAIDSQRVTIVCGATGSGKTTQLPKLCLRAGLGVEGMIGHTQPRRLAARSVARRIAEETGTELGEGVGYKVRFADRTSPQCRVKLMTDGILLQEFKRDRNLHRYDCLIVDEAHERSLNIDFILGYLKRLLRKRRDLKLIVTSATIDPQRFSAFFDHAPIVEVGGRSYPIEMRYAPADDAPLAQSVCGAVAPLIKDGEGDVLVFLPGERDINDCTRELKQSGVARGVEVLPLYARLNVTRQQKIFSPGARRRVILATNIAETSLTVPRIRYVVDSGLARIGRYSHRSKLQRLPIEHISRASADQRAGRCGRLGPGVCVRLYDDEDYAQRMPFEEPQIRRSNLSGVILQMSALGLGAIESFEFLDPPDQRLIKDGYTVLRELNAIDEDCVLTPLGRRMSRLPLAPRLSRALLAASDLQCLEEALIIVSGLSVPDPRERAPSRDGATPEVPAFVDPRSDWMTLLNIWRAYAPLKREGERWRMCKSASLSRPRMDEWGDVHRQLLNLCREVKLTRNRRPADYATIHRALLFGFVSHLGQRDEGNLYRGARGRQFVLFPGSALAAKPPPWVVATELIETSRVFAHRVAQVKAGWIKQAAEHLLKREYLEPLWSESRGEATVREQASVFGLVLGHGKRVPMGPIDPAGARRLLIDHLLVAPHAPLPHSFARHNARLRVEAAQWESRLRRVLVDDATLATFFSRSLPPDITDRKRFARWYDEATQREPDVLQLAAADLGLDQPPGAAWYPLLMHVGGNDLPLTYRFAPGTEEDGVTLALPLALTGHLSAAQLSWLIPGYLYEKTLALLRALPKRERRKLTPAADAARGFVAWAIAADLPGGREGLGAALARFVRDTYSVFADAASFDSVTLPVHLNLRVALVEDGREVGSGRDFDALVERHAPGESVARMPPGQWQRERVLQWDLGELPEAVEVTQGGVTISGCPALTEEGTAVALRLYPDVDSALQQHGDGVVRLAMLQIADKLKYLRKNLPDANRLSLLYLQLGDVERLLDDLIFGALRDGAGVVPATIRDAGAFRSLVEHLRREAIALSQARAALCLQILTARQALASGLDSQPPADAVAAADLRSQLEHLVAPRFMRDTPARWLKHLPRFLQAMTRRVQRIGERGGENTEQRDTVAAMWQRYLAVDDPARRARLENYRWLVEELRVSVFAQPVKTSCPVSVKRLDAAWRAAQL